MLSSVFFGTPEFSLQSLEATYKNSKLLAVVSQPDRPRGRGQKLSPCEVRAWAQAKGIPAFAPESLKKDNPEKTRLLEFLVSNKPDLFIVTAYGLIFPQSFLDLARVGAFNVHGSLLPRWRGAAPIQRALQSGDLKTGVCLQKMIFEMDAGDVFLSREVAVQPEHDANTLASELSKESFLLIEDFFAKFPSGSLQSQKQTPAQITFAEKIKKEEGQWSLLWTPQQLINNVRAFAVWPKVSCQIEGLGEMKILNAARANASNLSPGEILVDINNSRVLLGCAAGDSVELLKVQFPGKAPCVAYDYFQNLGTQTKLRAL